MAERLRFYVDQHVPAAASRGLRQRGVDVLTTQDAGRCGSSDAEQLRFAASERRVMVTFDPDYLALHAGGVEHEGIAWCQQRKHTVGQLVRALLVLYTLLGPDEMRNHIEYL